MTNLNLIQTLKKAPVVPNSLVLQFIGQAGMIIQGNKDTLVIDPFLSDYAERKYGLIRNYEPAYKPEDLQNIDYYLITHDHADHLDPGTVKICAQNSPNTLFIAPAYCYKKLVNCGVREENIFSVKDNQWNSIGEMKFRAIPAAHEELEKDPKLGHRFVGYICQLNGVTFYHAGDTVIYPELMQYLQEQEIDIAMLPINGRDTFRFERGAIGNMNYKEAAELAHIMNFDMTIPVHYDTFADNTEPPGHFANFMYENYPYQKFHMMAREERMLYVKL